MNVTPGSRIGVYEVVSALGAGGMGTVHRARDTRLGRSVALKTLPPEFALDADRRARFEREAKTLATLNHPHIAQIYGLEEVPGMAGAPPTLALAMELVEGEDLAQRLARGPVPLDEALPLARQIAEGLEAAHEAGIVHRDLKPANIRVTADGVVKVLDFGLAKPMEPVAASVLATHSPTLTSPALTTRGIVLGTAAYMAPEQAKGKPVDRRADIWAFGCVLYELLTGRRAFEGDDVTEILAAIVKTEPDWTRLPATTPRHIKTLLMRCLAKDKTQRLQHIGDARLELAHPLSTSEAHPSAIAVPRGAWAAAGALAGALGVFAWSASREVTAPKPAQPHLQYTVDVPTTRFLGPANFVLSPDGEMLAYSAPGNDVDPAEYGALLIRPLGALQSRRVGAVAATIRALSWSPDGKFLLTNGGGLRVTDVATGANQVIEGLTGGLLSYGVAWGANRTFLRALGPAGLQRFTGDLGSPEASTIPPSTPDEERVFPSFLPDLEHYLFVSRRRGTVNGEICVGQLRTADVKCLGATASANPAYSAGHLLYLSGRQLVARPYDAVAQAFRGDPARVASDVALGYLGLGAYSVTANGRLVYRTGNSGVEQFAWLTRSGEHVGTAGDPRIVLNFDLAADGRTVVTTDGERLWVTDLVRGVTSQHAAALGGGGVSPVISPDGSRIAVSHVDNSKIAIHAVSGAGEPLLVDRPDTGVIEDWSPDGAWLALTSGLLVSTSGRQPVRFTTVPQGTTLDEVTFSPDGRWVTFNLSGPQLGMTQVFVAPTSGAGERWQVSTNGGAQGRWSPDGREIFYLATNGDMMAVAVHPASGRLNFSTPTRLFATGLRVSAIQDQFAVAPDGRFLVSRPVIPPDQEKVTVVVNWPALLTGVPAAER